MGRGTRVWQVAETQLQNLSFVIKSLYSLWIICDLGFRTVRKSLKHHPTLFEPDEGYMFPLSSFPLINCDKYNGTLLFKEFQLLKCYLVVNIKHCMLAWLSNSLQKGEKNWQYAPGGMEKALKAPPLQLEHFSGVSLYAWSLLDQKNLNLTIVVSQTSVLLVVGPWHQRS